MNSCQCKINIEAELLPYFAAKYPDAQNAKSSLEGYGLIFGSGNSEMQYKPYMPLKITADMPLKKGGTKQKTFNQSMFFNYCPFCGIKFEKAEK